MRKFLIPAAMMLLMLMAAAPARAADVDGKWAGSLDTPMGAVNVGFNLKADGATLTGTTTGPDGGDIAIKNGKIDGDKISFVVSLDFGGMAFDLNYTGVVKPGELALTIDVMGMQMAFTAKKAQ
jgi:opacity protein-like surface antigen